MELSKKDIDFLVSILKKYIDTSLATITNRSRLKVHHFEEQYMRTVNGGLPLDQSLFRTYLQTCGKVNVWIDSDKTGVLPTDGDQDVLYFLWVDGSYVMYIYTDTYVLITTTTQIDDLNVSGATTYSSQKIVSLIVTTCLEISYDNLISGLQSNNAQGAIDELKFLIDAIESNNQSVSATGAPLYLSNEDSDVLGYKKIKSTPDTLETILPPITLTTTEQLIRTYLFDLPIGVTTIAAGNWLGSVIGKISNAAGTSKLRVEAFLRHINETETTLFSSLSPDINNTDYEPISAAFAGDIYSCLITDRLGFRVYGVTSGANRTLTTKIGDGNLSYFSTPLSIRHDQTRDKNSNPDFLHITETEKTNFVNASDFVEDFISNATDILHADLLALINNNELIPGSSYRITNYSTTTVQADTQSAGHDFDVIVTALSTNKLSENASAVQRDGDTYFANAKLEAWELKYCIDNDTNRFAWADSVNGKGVIYYMKDEWGNECPYDFKNIQFIRTLTDGVLDLDDGVDTWVYTFNAYNMDNSNILDSSLLNGLYQIDDADIICKNNMIKSYSQENQHSGYIRKQELNNIVFLNRYSFDEDRYFENYSNTFGEGCGSNTFGNHCCSNTFGDNFSLNTFGDNCGSNTFGDNCGSNTIGDECYFNKFDTNCNRNTFGNSCYSNTFGTNCHSNTFGNNCYSNMFGNSCYSNTFGTNCHSNTFGNSCYSNTFGDWCRSNTFGYNCYSNMFGDTCYSNTFGNECYSNKFYHGVSGTTPKDFIKYLTLEDGVSNNNFYSDLTTSNQFYLQRIKISGLENTTQTDTIITLPTTNTQYEWLICYTSDGVLKQYCPNDLTNNRTYKIEDTSVSTWAESAAYAGYGFQAQIDIADLSEADSVNVVFSLLDAISGNYAPAIEIYSGYILVFSKVNTTIIIPTIEITKIDL